MSDLHHECGVAAVYHLPGAASPLCPPQGPEEISRLMPRMLLDIQNRGQLSAGMTTYNPDRKQLLDTYKELGSVSEVFRLSHRGKCESLMQQIRRPGGDRPRALRHLRRRRPQLRPAVRAASSAKAQVVQLRASTASWPTTPKLRDKLLADDDNIWPARPTPKSSCTRSAASCRAIAGRR